MSWFAVLRLFLSVLDGFFDFVERHELMNAGELKMLEKLTRRMNGRLHDAAEARAAVERDIADGKLRDPDRYQRPRDERR